MSGSSCLLAIVCVAVLFALLAGCSEGRDWPPKFIRSRIATTDSGWHSTTRGTVRLVWPHRGRWLVFRGDPDTYHFSTDGRTWTATEAVQAGRSHLIQGDTIYTRYSVLVEGAPKWVFDHFVAKGTVRGNTIAWGPPVKLDTRVGYYPDLQQDQAGYFTMTGRAANFTEVDGERKVTSTEVLWKRSRRPNDITEWCPDVRCIRHVGDSHVGKKWTQVGSTVHENVTLADGKSYVFGMMTVGGAGRLYGNLFDGTAWGAADAELAGGMSTWPGTDRRMCAVFDRPARILHLGYVDGEGGLWYRRATPPYGPKDWSPPLRLQPVRCFCVVLALDTSKTPADVYVLFGRTRYRGRDRRNTYGEIHLQRFDGQSWSEPVLVSEPETKDNWYPNMNADVRHGIGVLYLRGSEQTRGKNPPLDIRFATPGPVEAHRRASVYDTMPTGKPTRGIGLPFGVVAFRSHKPPVTPGRTDVAIAPRSAPTPAPRGSGRR